MNRIFLIAIAGIVGCSVASATTYYVSSSTGSDANSGTSSGAAWQTVAKVNGQTFQAGDSILFRRGDVWNESLAPPSSGTSGNPITFDAYGTGTAPNLTGYYAVPTSAWVLVSGNAWKAAVPATFSTVNFCLFGSVWGQKVGASSSNLTAQWNFYFANGYVYVYSVGNPASYYGEAIVPIALSNVPVINVSGKSWLTFQHFLMNWFDQYGVYVQGASDHLVFANMEADSMIPQGAQPLGFYVNESAPGPGDIKIYNSEAHMDYDGFRFDGAATAITMVNDKAYANRDGALVDNTSAVTYSHCHFYASSLAVAGSTDVLYTSGTGPTAGAGNIAADTPPAVQAYKRYPAQVSLTVDDVGMTPGADTYYANTVLPVADAAGIPVGTAVTVGYTSTIQPLISEIQGWISAGRDVTSHSVSHTYYTNTDALDIQYTGIGTAATLSISNKTLTIRVTGASDSVSYNLTQGQAQGTILGLQQALAATGQFTTAFLTPCQGPYGTGCSAYTAQALLAQDLADVSGQDVKSAVYPMQLDATRLTTDEITLSRQWMTSNLTGLPLTPVYVYPGGYETTTMQGITAGVPYGGARGALKEDLGVKDTYASGFNAQNITSFGVNPTWMGVSGVTPALLKQKIQALVWKQMVWGVPWGIFWHMGELTNVDPVGGTEITNLIQDLKSSGATIQTNTGLVNWLTSGTPATGTDGNSYYKLPASSMVLDFRPTASSPVVDVGQNLGAAYQFDINGVNQNSYGINWEIGAHVFAGYSAYGSGVSGSHFAVGSGVQTAGVVQLPQAWVNSNEWVGTTTNVIYFPASSTGGSWTCGATGYGPYTAGSQTSLQQAVTDAEACRMANGSGTTIVIPPALFSGTTGITLPQTAGDTSSNFIILTSSTPLPVGQTVCSHGIQDNVAASTQPGIRNPGCNGSALSYQLGTTITSVSGSFTLANGEPATAAAYNDIVSMYTLQCTASNCNSISTGTMDANGISPHHYVILNAELRPQAGLAGPASPVKIGTGAETAVSQLPTHIHVAYSYMHGDWTDAPVSGGVATGYPTGANSLPGDLVFNGCNTCSLMYSYTDRSIRPGAEGHAVLLLLAQQIKIGHNWLEGNSSGAFCGGQQSTITIANYTTCQDVEDRGNRYTYPYSWMLAADAEVLSSVKKNGSTGSGYLVGDVLTVVQSGAFGGTATVATVSSGVPQTYTITSIGTGYTGANALATNGGTGTGALVNITTGYMPNGNLTGGNGFVRKNAHESKASQRYLLDGNIIENVDNTGAQQGITLSFKTASGIGTNWWITQTDTTISNNILRNSCVGPSVGNRSSSTSANGVSLGTMRYNILNNLLYDVSAATPGCRGQSPIWGWRLPSASSITQWAATASRDATGTIATLTLTPTTNTPVSATVPGDPVQVYGCTDTSFNTTTGVQSTMLGPPALAGTVPSALTVLYANAGTPNATTTGCTYDNVQAYPQNIAFSHNSDFLNIAGPNDPYMDVTGSDSYALLGGMTFTNSVFVGGGAASTRGEGTRTLTEDLNSATLVYASLLVPGRDALATCPSHTVAGSGGAMCYTEFGGSHTGATPPVTAYLTPTSYCAGNDPTAENCSGILGAMSTGSFPSSLNDWHLYRLCHVGDTSCNNLASLYAAGGIHQGSDLTDMGMNATAIDAAEISTQYQCIGSCGNGPQRDMVPQIEILAPGAGTSMTAVNTYLKPSPYINGIVYSLYWACSDQDGTSSHYTWANFDNQIASDGWAVAGKKIMVVLGGVTYGGTDSICYGGGGWGTTGVGNYGTPAYVWTALGSSNYVSCSGQQIPNYLNAAYLNSYKNWVSATLAHLAAASYGSNIGYVRVAWGKGGETTPIANWDVAGNCPDGSGNNTLTTDWGYTLSGWEAFLQNGMTFEAGLGSPLQLMISITPMGPSGGSQATVPNFTAPVAASLHIGFGTQGLMASDVNNISGCGGNWCNLFATYAGQVPLETQTYYQSCASTNESGTCSSMAIATGTLDPLLVWAGKGHATSFEMYYEDACAMLCPGYSMTGYAAYPQANYLAAMQNLENGNF